MSKNMSKVFYIFLSGLIVQNIGCGPGSTYTFGSGSEAHTYGQDSYNPPSHSFGSDSSDPPSPPVIVSILMGQSNAIGYCTDSVPAGLPDSEIPFWPTYNSVQSDAFRPLGPIVYRGLELTLGLDLKAAGYDVAILKVAKGGTSITEWVEGTTLNNNFLVEMAQFKTALSDRFPGRSFSWHFIWDQGESEALHGTA